MAHRNGSLIIFLWHTVCPVLVGIYLLYLLRKLTTRYAKYKTDSVITAPYLAIKYVPSILYPGRGKIFPSSSKRPDWLWGPLSLLFSGYRGRIPRGLSDRGVRLITHLHLVLRFRIIGAIPILSPYMLPWRAQGQRFFTITTLLELSIFSSRGEFIFPLKIQR